MSSEFCSWSLWRHKQNFLFGADHTIRDERKADTLGFVVVFVLIIFPIRVTEPLAKGKEPIHVYLLICQLITSRTWERWEATYYGK